MKKGRKMALCAAASLAVVAAAVFGLLAVFRPAPAGDAIVRIGKYPLSEQELRAAIIMRSMEEGRLVTCEEAARDYAQICIAADEIVGTEYAIEQNGWEDYEETEAEKFDRDYDLNMQLCEKNNVTREDIIAINSIMSWQAATQIQHIQMTVEKWYQQKGITPSAEEYNEEMAEKAAKLRYVVLDPQAVQALDGFGVTHIDYEPE